MHFPFRGPVWSGDKIKVIRAGHSSFDHWVWVYTMHVIGILLMLF